MPADPELGEGIGGESLSAHDSNLMKYVVGIIAVGIGFLVVWKADWFVNNLGHIAWAEEHLGSEGGTRLFYKLIGIGIIILAFLLMTGGLFGILSSILKPSGPALE